MGQETIVHLTFKTMMMVLRLSLPPIAAAALTGILVSLLQAVTQLQEQTTTFAVKLVTVTLTLIIVGRWLGGELYELTVQIFSMFPG